jgi:N-acetylornithine carbamoyltransferase
MKIDFISGAEFPLKELQKIIDQAISFKKTKKLPDLSGKILTLLFANPSLRTRLSFESGMKKMGGIVNTLELAGSWQFEYRDGVKMDGDKQEHIKEAAAVISRYSDVIALRNSQLVTTAAGPSGSAKWEDVKKDNPINQLAKYASKPVINMESNMYHPCQSMADMMTMQEKIGDVKGKKYVITWAPHIKPLALATPHSQFLTPAIFGMNTVLAAPDGYTLDEDVMKLAEQKSKEAGGSITVTNNQKEAFEGADVVVAKSWASLKYFGDWENEAKHRKQFENWIVDQEKMKLTNNAMFMHCLPVRRNIEVADDVLDGPNSSVIDEAENRMWAQMAIVSYILNNNK